MTVSNCQFYEGETLRTVTGEAIRPGGLDLSRRALELCRLQAAARILDVACGAGSTVQMLRDEYPYQAAGIDLSARLLSVGRRRGPDLPLAQASAASLPIASGAIQAVFLECSLSVMAEPGWVLQEIHRVLAMGAPLVLSDLYLRNPQAAGPLRALPFTCCLQGALSQDEIFSLLDEQGFEVIHWEDHSARVRELTGRIVFSMGSMASFWQQTAPVQVDPFDLQIAIGRAKPGYFLLVARKAARK